MTTCAVTSNGKFNLELNSDGLKKKISLEAREKVTIYDVAVAIHNDCYNGDLGFNISGFDAECTVKTEKHKFYGFTIKESNLEGLIVQIAKQISL